MRYFPTAVFAAAVALALAAPAAAAPPNSIDDCEKIDAADAYNQCLALFGPPAHTHGGSAKEFGGDGVGGSADVVETANPEATVPASVREGSHGHHAHAAAASRHHRYYGHNYRGHRAAPRLTPVMAAASAWPTMWCPGTRRGAEPPTKAP